MSIGIRLINRNELFLIDIKCRTLTTSCKKWDLSSKPNLIISIDYLIRNLTSAFKATDFKAEIKALWENEKKLLYELAVYQGR